MKARFFAPFLFFCIMKIILFQPCIPQNTGNIIRTCKVTGNDLILVKPLGFRFSSQGLKRAGLDYALDMNIELIHDLEEFLSQQKSFYFFSSKAKNLYTEVSYKPESCLIFGSEVSGLPESLFKQYPEHFVTLPMVDNQRCLNLSNSVAIAIYEAWRQMEFQSSKNASQLNV